PRSDLASRAWRMACVMEVAFSLLPAVQQGGQEVAPHAAGEQRSTSSIGSRAQPLALCCRLQGTVRVRSDTTKRDTDVAGAKRAKSIRAELTVTCRSSACF